MEPRDAATVMLVRDAPALEVFMLRRNLRSAFVAGASLFPGGAVDREDRDPELLRRTLGLDDADASRRLAVASGGIGFWVAAIRESFEEAGVLLACDAATGASVDGASPELADDRAELLAGRRAFVDIVRRRGLALDAAALEVFGHWITPTGAPRRYDTWFFVAAAPAGHAYEHDDDETVASEWARPADLLERARAGHVQLIHPTLRSLQALARFPSAEGLLAAVRGAWRDDPEPLAVTDAPQGWMLKATA